MANSVEIPGGVPGARATGKTGTDAKKATKKATLQDQFMEILLAQLRYQDPMAPMQGREFFSQMAEFSAATEMESLNKKMDQVLSGMNETQGRQDLLAAARLIGRRFEATVGKDTVAGVIESVGMKDGKVVVRYKDATIPVESLIVIGGIADAADGD